MLLPRVLAHDGVAKDGVEAVHDFRVWSRRLQQVVTALAPAPRPAEARTIVRALRRARRSLGGWRDCDVMIDLLERRARRARDPEERKAYAMIRDLAERKRDREIRRARRRLASRKLFTLAHRAEQFLHDLPHGGSAHGEGLDAETVIAAAAARADADWREALARACAGFDPAAVHAFRIRTKRLRYRVELARDLGARDAEPALDFLRATQDVLGAWHDRLELLRLTAQALANPDFLLSHSRLVAVLLRKADRERSEQSERVRRLLARTSTGAESSALDHWIARHCGKPPAARPKAEAHESPPARPEQNREAPPHAGQPALAHHADAEAAPLARETSDAAPGPVDDFVKAINLLPR